MQHLNLHIRMKLLKSLQPYWLWFYSIITLLSCMDFLKHITYSGTSYFQDNWLTWLAFSASSTLIIFTCTYFMDILLSKIFKSENIFAQLFSIFTGMFVHINFSGPILDWVIFRKKTLMFQSNYPMLVIWIIIFCTLRLVFYLKIKYRRSPEKIES